MAKIIFKATVFLFLIPFLFSCGGEKTKSSSDSATSVRLTYYRGEDSIQFSTQIEEKEKVSLLAGMFNGEDAIENHCSINGKASFFTGDSLISAGEFSTVGNCLFFKYKDGDHFVSVHLNEEEVNFLNQMGFTVNQNKLETLKWFVGNWVMKIKGEKNIGFEEWEMTKINSFSGKGFELNGKDTTFSEILEMNCDDENIYYIPTLKTQGPVKFKLTKMDSNFVMFENPENNFPKKISYEKMGDSMLVAHIQGPASNGKMVTKDYPFHRVKEVNPQP